MHKRTQTALTGCFLAAALVATPAVAQHSVDEAATRANSGGGSGGAGESHGGFVLESSDGDHKVLVGGRLQGRLEAISWDDALERDTSATFSVNRARLYFLGHVMGNANRFFVQIGADAPSLYATDSTTMGDFEFFDAWIKHKYSDAFALKIGQFKVPFGRQALTSSGKLQFPDRAIAIEAFGTDYRDVGVSGSGGFSDNLFQYTVAVVNGYGSNTLNLDNSFAYFARLSLNPSGDYGYSEGDLNRSEDASYTLGVAASYFPAKASDPDIDLIRFNIDGGFKANGFSAQGEFFVHNAEIDGFEEDITHQSYYVQAGYMVGDDIEVAARASRVFWDGDDNDETEYSFGVNLFSMGHRLKWQAAWSLFDFEGVDITNHRFVAQAQLWF